MMKLMLTMWIDEMVNMANIGDATLHVSTASSHFVSIVSATSSHGNIQALIAKAVWEKKNILSVKIPNVQTLGAMRRLKEIQIIQVPGALPKIAKRVKKPLKTEVDDLVINPMHKEFNALNRLEIQRWNAKNPQRYHGGQCPIAANKG
ncbi:hypothetical protein Tco_1436223 [Tanacetum coccineum]